MSATHRALDAVGLALDEIGGDAHAKPADRPPTALENKPREPTLSHQPLQTLAPHADASREP